MYNKNLQKLSNLSYQNALGKKLDHWFCHITSPTHVCALQGSIFLKGFGELAKDKVNIASIEEVGDLCKSGQFKE